jgi:Bax protein
MKILLGLLFVMVSLFSASLPENYYEIKNTKKMKQEFFSFMKKLAIIENKKVMDDRVYIINNFHKKEERLLKLQKRYGLKQDATLREYLYVIDVIPISLVLSQAAIESGWGKSRFFKKAKNIFGQWTWSGKGLEPLKRDSGKKHKIKIFPSFQSSVRAYLINLNKGWGYKDLRDLRQMLRDKNQKLSGYALAEGLIKYSQKREEYIKILKSFIKGNKLNVYDTL